MRRVARIGVLAAYVLPSARSPEVPQPAGRAARRTPPRRRAGRHPRLLRPAHRTSANGRIPAGVVTPTRLVRPGGRYFAHVLVGENGSVPAGSGRSASGGRPGRTRRALAAPSQVPGARDTSRTDHRSSPLPPADGRTLPERATGDTGSVRTACSGIGAFSHR